MFEEKEVLVKFETSQHQRAYVKVEPLGTLGNDRVMFQITYAISQFPKTKWQNVPPQYNTHIIIGTESCLSYKQYAEVITNPKVSSPTPFEAVLEEALKKMRNFLETQVEGGNDESR